MVSEPLVLEPLVVLRLGTAGPTGAEPRPASSDSEFIALYVPGTAGTEVIVTDASTPPGAFDTPIRLALVAPYRFLAGVLPVPIPERLPRSMGLRALERYLDGLLDSDRGRLCERQRAFAARALHGLLTAALMPSVVEQGLGSRRRVSLSDRIAAHIDAHLDDPLTAESLCAALGCSRTSLYRATASAGGAAELILKRRLMAVRRRLSDEDEPRSISAIAEGYGFDDATQFNRRFKALFGVPPGEIRRSKAGPLGATHLEDGLLGW